jgi:hypothetical protein
VSRAELKPSARRVSWHPTGKGEHPYEAVVGGQRWVLRVNDFPAEPMYTVLVDGVAVEDVESWPAGWERPE